MSVAPASSPSLLLRALGALLATMFLSTSTWAAEGKWLPEQVPKLDPAMLKRMGLELPPGRLWDPQTGTGLLSAAVNLSGCSGAFISETGLVITNHHCVFGIIAEHSTAQRNLLEDGFVATSRADELPDTTARLRVPVAFRDATDEVHAVAAGAKDDVEIFARTDRKKKELVATCEQTPGKRCDVATFYGGLRHIMMEQIELTDVRLVYAPPRAIGEFGGEVDNWMWPRHTGDFSIVRAWVDPKPPATTTTTASMAKPDISTHVPYRPAFHFPLAKRPVAEGDFVMVLGYPGVTVRELLADEMAHRRDRTYPWLIRFGDRTIDVLEQVKDKDGAIAVAPLLKGHHNRRKNARGQLEGLARGRIIENKRARDSEVLTWAQRGHPDAIAAHALLQEELRLKDQSFERDMVLSQVFSGSKALGIAVRLARLQSERDKPDLERDEQYMERERPRQTKELVRDQKAFFAPADRALFALFVNDALALPPGQRIAAVDAVFGRLKTDKARLAAIDGLFKKTKLLTDKTREPLLSQPATALRAQKDPLLQLAFGINVALDEKKREDDRREGASLRIRPAWMQTVLDQHQTPLAPDANRTLRVSFGNVRGYSPADGVQYLPFTHLSGVFAKHTGTEPFSVPGRLLELAQKDTTDVTVNFLADADTTGGNSGSPVVNGRGELVGVNFDRVWENVANDFGYNPAIARNVSVDVGYITWLLKDVDHATALVQELGLEQR